MEFQNINNVVKTNPKTTRLFINLKVTYLIIVHNHRITSLAFQMSNYPKQNKEFIGGGGGIEYFHENAKKRTPMTLI